MGVMCNRPGGIALKLNKGDGTLVRTKLVEGYNDVDSESVKAAIEQLPPAMAEALTSGENPVLVLDAKSDAPPAPSKSAPVETEEAPKLGAAEKAKVARAATSLAELRNLAEGEERKTVLDAIDKRAVELEAGDE